MHVVLAFLVVCYVGVPSRALPHRAGRRTGGAGAPLSSVSSALSRDCDLVATPPAHSESLLWCCEWRTAQWHWPHRTRKDRTFGAGCHTCVLLAACAVVSSLVTRVAAVPCWLSLAALALALVPRGRFTDFTLCAGEKTERSCEPRQLEALPVRGDNRDNFPRTRHCVL